MLRLALAFSITLLPLGCGARSPLGGPSFDEELPGADGGVVLPDGAAAPAKLCPAWVATHPPVQLSNTASIMELQSALGTSSGVLVGYADEQFPPVDPRWHARLVSYGTATLGDESSLMPRNSSQLGWTGVSLAQGNGRIAAVASDQVNGMFFVPIDQNGAPTGAPTRTPGDPGRYLLGTSTGFSALRSAFDPSGLRHSPVELASLDASGQVLGSRTILDASVPVDWYWRFGLADGSFVIVWAASDACPGCRTVRGQHFSESGVAMASVARLHDFGANEYGNYTAAATSTGFLLAWSEGGPPNPIEFVGEPFDPDGVPTGGATHFAKFPGPNAPLFALATAPGGDLRAAWVDDSLSQHPQAYVQSVRADGSPEGSVATVSTAAPSSDTVMVVASPLGAMLLYQGDIPNFGIEVYAVPLACGS